MRIIKTEDEFIHKPEQRKFSFYQICKFPRDDKHQVRKIYYNEFGDVIGGREKKLDKDKLNKFLEKCPEYRYRIYATYNLDQIGYPDSDEVLTSGSLMLNNLVQ